MLHLHDLKNPPMKNVYKILFLTFILLLSSRFLFAQTLPAGFSRVQVVTGLRARWKNFCRPAKWCPTGHQEQHIAGNAIPFPQREFQW
jgi:hypothetical protein